MFNIWIDNLCNIIISSNKDLKCFILTFYLNISDIMMRVKSKSENLLIGNI